MSWCICLSNVITLGRNGQDASSFVVLSNSALAPLLLRADYLPALLDCFSDFRTHPLSFLVLEFVNILIGSVCIVVSY